MPSNVQISIDNKMGDGGNPNPVFDMALATKNPVMTSGAISIAPTDPIASRNASSNTNGGVYSGSSTSGIVAYNIPGAMAILVIYFDTANCYLDTIAPNAAITTDLVATTKDKAQLKVTGTLVIGRKIYKYTATSEAKLDGDINKCSVESVCAEC